jgi:RimJ/RimL family protein N-acetyltransferase
MPLQFRLRNPTVTDAPFVVWLDTPAAVREHVLMATPPTQEQAESVIVRWLTFCDPFGYFIIELGSDNRPVGWIHAKPCVHIDGAIELGWRLHPDVWGHGIATSAAKLLIAQFRAQNPSVMFTATTLRANEQSKRVMDRLGMILHTSYLHADVYPALLYNLEPGINVE